MCSLQRNYDVIRNWERFETGPLTVQVLTVLTSRRYQCVYIAIRLYTEILKSSDHISIGVFKCESVINGSEMRVIRSNKSLDFSLHNILASAYTITIAPDKTAYLRNFVDQKTQLNLFLCVQKHNKNP